MERFKVESASACVRLFEIRLILDAWLLRSDPSFCSFRWIIATTSNRRPD